MLTDGSGSAGKSRITSTRTVLANTGASEGAVFAAFTDHELYDVFLRHDSRALAAVTLRLSEEWVEMDAVVTDAWENYNPSHDVCRVVAELAVERASKLASRTIPLFEYPVVHPFAITSVEGEVVIRLDEDAVGRKLASAHAYSELRGDVEEMLHASRGEDLRLEILRPAQAPVTSEKPFYETRGEQQVAARRYDVVLRYGQHLAHFLDSLSQSVHGAA